jgi:alginate O-acetyltransferase complex protein AlgI
MSLSLWIRDYIYIPLGGNRHGPARRFLNVMIALALCGLWHGPAWHFAVWGLYHGLGLALSVVYVRIPVVSTVVRKAFHKEPLAPLALTQLFACAGWLLFFYPVPEAVHMARLLVTL